MEEDIMGLIQGLDSETQVKVLENLLAKSREGRAATKLQAIQDPDETTPKLKAQAQVDYFTTPAPKLDDQFLNELQSSEVENEASDSEQLSTKSCQNDKDVQTSTHSSPTRKFHQIHHQIQEHTFNGRDKWRSQVCIMMRSEKQKLDDLNRFSSLSYGC